MRFKEYLKEQYFPNAAQVKGVLLVFWEDGQFPINLLGDTILVYKKEDGDKEVKRLQRTVRGSDWHVKKVSMPDDDVTVILSGDWKDIAQVKDAKFIAYERTAAKMNLRILKWLQSGEKNLDRYFDSDYYDEIIKDADNGKINPNFWEYLTLVDVPTK